MEKIFSLTNREISENCRNTVFYLMLSDFRGAMAYWLIAQESKIDIDINEPLNGFTKYLKLKYFTGEHDVIKFTYNELELLISEDVFDKIPELIKLNKMRPNFYDLGALARNVFYMICREQITQPL